MTKPYLPSTDSGKIIWLNNFAAKIGGYAQLLDLTPEEIASVQADALSFAYWVGQVEFYITEKEETVAYKNLLRDGPDTGGDTPAPQTTITLATNQTNPTPVNIALLGGDGQEVTADYGNNTTETKTVNNSTYTLFSILYGIAGNYAIKLMGNVAAFLELFIPDAKITAINLPEGINISALDLLNNLLTSFFLPLSCINMISMQLNNNALDQQSINQILIQLAANGLSNGMVNLSGGTNAAPSGQGIAAKNQLIARGWTVITN